MPEAVQAFDTAMLQSENLRQYDASKMIDTLLPAVRGRVGPKMLVLGVTPYDLFAGTSNYLFGSAATGVFFGVISSARFRAAFNDEAPKRERFRERLLKQSLSSVGFMVGPRCDTPECARAYSQSLAEHDQKPSTLCPTCRAAFGRFFGPLPDD